MTAIHYILDPMCSWCWAFQPQWEKVIARIPDGLSIRYVMGGLAPESDEPMPRELRGYIRQIWGSIAERTGTRFNFEFWDKCEPRRSTYPACRAVIAARLQGADNTTKMIKAIQEAYYLNARNPSDSETLNELAVEIGLDSESFETALDSHQVAHLLQQEIVWARSVGANGFPSVLMEKDNDELLWLARGYSEATPVVQRLESALA